MIPLQTNCDNIWDKHLEFCQMIDQTLAPSPQRNIQSSKFFASLYDIQYPQLRLLRFLDPPLSRLEKWNSWERLLLLCKILFIKDIWKQLKPNSFLNHYHLPRLLQDVTEEDVEKWIDVPKLTLEHHPNLPGYHPKLPLAYNVPKSYQSHPVCSSMDTCSAPSWCLIHQCWVSASTKAILLPPTNANIKTEIVANVPWIFVSIFLI